MAGQGAFETNVDRLLSQLTWPEKVSLLSGIDGWQTPEISRLGIGSLKTTDGPVGARGNQIVDGPRAAFLPATVLHASTWSKSDIKEIGRLLSKEAKTKTSQILLAPTVCCARNPLGGRNFESFSEDPLLSGLLATEYVAGVQESGEVVATAKHFVANDQEYQRFSINANISEKALREIYLRPFEMLVKSPSPPGCFMTAYNKVNGTHMDANKEIVTDVLRDMWGYKGLVMSDWGGTNTTVESVLAGCDLEMPGPPEKRGQKLLEAVESGKHDGLMDAIDASCRRILTLAKKLNLLGLSPEEAKATRSRKEYSSTTPEDLKLVRNIAAKGTVLLKNSVGALPLTPSKLANKKVAFLGPNSKICTPGGGGSASMNPQYLSHPMDAFKALAEELNIPVEVNHSAGVYSKKWLPLTSEEQWELPSKDSAEDVEDGSMLKLDFYANETLSGPVHQTQYRKTSYVDLFDTAPADLLGKPYSYRLTSHLTPKTTGSHSFGISSVGTAKLYINGQLLIDNDDWTAMGETFYAFGSVEVVKDLYMEAGKTYVVTVECATRNTLSESSAIQSETELDPTHVFACHAGVRLGYLEQLPSMILQDAVTLSKNSDYTVVVLGLDEEWESEGYDRDTMALPPSQDLIVRTLLEESTNPESIIIVNQSGSPVEMPWAEDPRIGTIIQAWYGGQEAGNALADVLLGVVSPSGHLPVTWPRKYEDLPFAADKKLWPGVDGNVCYDEGSLVGYRWYQEKGVEPHWWFGYGLTYTTFNISELSVKELKYKQGWEVSVEVQNTGSYSGEEVVQVYLSPSASALPTRVLAAFEKTNTLAPGDKEKVTATIDLRNVASWDHGKWVIEAGSYHVVVAQHAGDRASTLFQQVVLDAQLSWEP